MPGLPAQILWPPFQICRWDSWTASHEFPFQWYWWLLLVEKKYLFEGTTVHGVTKRGTYLSDKHFSFTSQSTGELIGPVI